MTMTETAAPTREALVALIVASGTDEAVARTVVDSLADEYIAPSYESFAAAQAEKAAIRDRLAANPTLCCAVSPRTNWKTAEQRYDVARGALRILDNVAAKHELPADAIAQALIDGQGTIADTIDTHGGDPRTDGFAGGASYYAFRYRLRDAIEVLTAVEREAERVRVEAARDEAWARQGLVRCDRCGGAGGSQSWPGFTCYDCDGRCATETGGRA